MYDFVYGCMSRTPCIHHSLPNPMVLLVDRLQGCAQDPLYPRQIAHFQDKLLSGMHNKAFVLLKLLHKHYDARYYVKIDSDVDVSNIKKYEHHVSMVQPTYFGQCVRNFPLVVRLPPHNTVIYAQGGIYVLSKVNIM